MEHKNNNFLSLLAKFWFLVLIVLVLIAFVAVYAVQNYSRAIKAKTVDGKSVVVSANKGINIFADDLYNQSLSAVNGIKTHLFFDQIINDAVELSEQETKEVNENTQAILDSFKQKNPQNYQEVLTQQLASTGFSDLKAYLIYSKKLTKFATEYVENKIKDNPGLLKDENGNSKYRLVSHILVKMADPKNPTTEEKEKLEKVESLLKEKAFKEVATELSDDPGSAANGGSLGVVSEATNFVPEFKAAALSLKEGEVSDWVYTQFGAHKILVDSTNIDDILAKEELKTQIYQTLLVDSEVIKAAIEKSKVEFPSPEAEAEFMNLIGLGE